MEHRRPFLMIPLHPLKFCHEFGPEPDIDGVVSIFPCHAAILASQKNNR